MERRRLGSTDLELTTIGLGTWVFGGRWGGAEDADSAAACHAALDAGVNWIDTADIYGQGRAEQIVGKVIRERRDEVIVATKGGVAWSFDNGALAIWREDSGDYLRMSLDRSLTALGLDHVDLYQVHWPIDGSDPADTMQALVDLKAAGKIREFGVSNYERPHLEAAHAAHPFASLQVGYHLFRDQIEAEDLPWCAANDVGVLAYGPLGHGLFTGKMTAETTFAENDWRRTSEFFSDEAFADRIAATKELGKVAADAGRPGGIAELATVWVLRRPEVASAIVGARNAEQARANAALAGRPLADDEAAAIADVLARHPLARRKYGHGEPPMRPATPAP